MRMTRLVFTTLRETPAEADIASHRLLLRGGFIRQVAAGLFAYLPLGLRVKHKVEAILRDEMNAIGGQEVSFPIVQPAEPWRRSGRWDSIGADMVRFKDRAGRDLCLGMTHEEVVAEGIKGIVRSYRQLPVMLYQIQTKFRDEPRARGGLIRVREFTMKDAYSFHADAASLEATYLEVYDAYHRIFRRCGLDAVAVESDMGMMGGSGAHEFMALTPVGEDALLLCTGCDYKANRQVARFKKPAASPEALAPLEEIATPGTATIEALAAFLGVPKARTAKAVFLVSELEHADERFVFAVLRGDMELNETKLSNHLGARRLRPATAEEIRRVGAEPGYGSPLGIDRDRVTLIVDDAVTASPNLVAGANRAGYHVRGTNYGRDYEADVVADIAAASPGDACPRCGAAMMVKRGVEVGNIFKLGDRYSSALGVTFLAEGGGQQPMLMGSYGIGPGRVLACIAQAHHDASGMRWPISVAPYHLALVSLGGARSPEVVKAADGIYERLKSAGTEVLYDDREASAGVKFHDADLLGLPLRLTVGGKGLASGMAELKVRRTGEVREVALERLLPCLQEAVEAEWQASLGTDSAS